jgi:hypothetical protein
MRRRFLAVGAAALAMVFVGGASGVSGSEAITTIGGEVNRFYEPRAGNGDGGPATAAPISLAEGLAVDGQGNV